MSLTQSGVILLVIDSTNYNSPHNTPENVPLVSLSLRYYFVSAEYLFALVLVFSRPIGRSREDWPRQSSGDLNWPHPLKKM